MSPSPLDVADVAGAASGASGAIPPAVDALLILASAGGDVFLAATPFALLALLAVLFVKEVTLQTKSAIERDAEPAEVPA